MSECEFCGDEALDPVEDRGGYVFCSARCAREFDAQVQYEDSVLARF